MAKPKPRTAATTSSVNKPHEVVDPRWLLKMFGLAILAALLCTYIAAGALYRYTSWQLVLHPTRNSGGGTALPTQRVQFAVDKTGQPHLAGEWYPADAGAPRANLAVLYLRGADGQLDPADGTQIAMLHGLGLNVFAFDYSGYGASKQFPHPSEQQMLEDASAAASYVAATYKPSGLILFGSGTGVSVAAQLAQTGTKTAGLIGYNADPEVLSRVKTNRASKLFPIALFHDRFSLDALKTLNTPKLLYTVGPLNTERTTIYKSAADPKLTVEVPTHNAATEQAALNRFLDAYLTSAPARLTDTAPCDPAMQTKCVE